MKKHTLLSLSFLLLGFSTVNTVFAENIINSEQGHRDYLDGIMEVQNKISEIKSRSLFTVENNERLLIKKTSAVLDNKNPKLPRPGKNPAPSNSTKEIRQPVTGRMETIDEIMSKAGHSGDRMPDDRSKTPLVSESENDNPRKPFPVKLQVRINKKGILEISNSARRASRTSEVRRFWHEASDAEIRDTFFIGKNTNQLSEKQNAELKERLGEIINEPNVKKFLITTRTAEHGGGLTIAGRGKGKPAWIKRLIRTLNYGSHPAEQLPREAFVINKRYGLIATSSGEPQITYTNWKRYKRNFGFTNFSIRNQRIAAMDLARESHDGRGFVSLMKGEMHNSFRYGTQPWESSVNSTLGKGQIKTIDYYKLSQSDTVLKQVAVDKNV